MNQDQIIPLVMVGIGLYLAWFGVHYWDSDTKWPSDPVKAVLTGKPIPTPSGHETAAQTAAFIEGTGGSAGGGAAPGGSGGSAVGPGILSKQQIMSVWTSNGGSSGTADIASAIALAESSGRTSVTSGNPDGGTNVGLWQLDTKGVGAGYTVTQLQDPNTNARVTVFGSANGTNWSAWETYATGAYKKFLGTGGNLV